MFTMTLISSVFALVIFFPPLRRKPCLFSSTFIICFFWFFSSPFSTCPFVSRFPAPHKFPQLKHPQMLYNFPFCWNKIHSNNNSGIRRNHQTVGGNAGNCSLRSRVTNTKCTTDPSTMLYCNILIKGWVVSLLQTHHIGAIPVNSWISSWSSITRASGEIVTQKTRPI